MWSEQDNVASANIRTYTEFFRAGGRREGQELKIGGDEEYLPADNDITCEARIRQLENVYLNMARGGDEVGTNAIQDYFEGMNKGIRWVERARIQAEPNHLAALEAFAERAYRRPLSKEERDDLLAYYHSAREKEGLDHEAAMRDSIVSVLMSPDFFYRIAIRN